jgi:ABC-type Fe3+ transport system permease subunit
MNWVLLKNSCVVSGLATLLATVLGLAVAIWALAVVALALPPFLVTNCWLDVLGEAGRWRRWLPVSMLSRGGAAWILGMQTWPITFFAVLAACQRLEPDTLESDPAVGGWALQRHLLLPLVRPALVQAGVLTFVLALNNFAVPAILQVKVFPAETWVRFSANFDTVGALRMSWPLIVLPLCLLLWLGSQRIAWPSLQGTVAARVFRRQLGRGWFWSFGLATVALCALSVALPLFQMLSVKRTWKELPGALAAGQLAIWNSGFLALGSATLCLVACLWAASFIKGPGGKLRSMLGCVLWLPFLTPGVLLGIALIALFNRSAFALFYPSAGIAIVALLIRYAAPGWVAVRHAVEGTDRNLRDMALISGASRWQLLRYVYWPQIAPQVAAAWYIVFLLCLWDVESIVLIVPPGGETMALRIFNLLHYGHNAQVNALCLALLIMALAPWVLYRALGALGERRPGARMASRLLVLPGLVALLFFPACRPKSPADVAAARNKIFSDVQIIGTRGVGVGQLNKPRSLTIDRQDNLYVVDMTGRVQKFSSNGTFLLSWQMPQTDLGKPKGMCRDCDGNIVVVEPHYQRVNHFSPDGKLVAQWGVRGTNLGQFILPRAVAFNSRHEVFVSEYSILERIQKFKWRGDRVSAGPSDPSPAAVTFAFGQVGNGPADFNRPEGLCVDAHDHLYVADSCNHRIQIYSSDGKLLRSHGKAGAGPGELSYPYDICVDDQGRQYVCEFGNSRIQVFDANDQPLEIIGGPGGAPGRFSNPWGVALDSAGNLYVADSQNHRVQKLIRREPARS